MSEPQTSPCRGCGKPVIWGKTKDGRYIPMDPRPPVYYIVEDENIVERASSHYVTHFATCPKADDFSGNRRKVSGANANE